MELTAPARKQKHWRFFAPEVGENTACQHMAKELAVDPLVARLLFRRGIRSVDQATNYLHPKLTNLHDPAQLPGVDTSVDRIERAVRNGQPIVIYGDYDVDGITASSILWHILKLAGAQVSTYTPHRTDEGYGLNCKAIRQLCQDDGETPLLISVDCGITALEPAREARRCGVDLIITDHHEFDADGFPDAFAIVHPRLPGSKYPFGSLCGAGVAFKLAWQFAKVHCGSERLPSTFREMLLDLLSLAALGTVADVVPLVDENRVITSYGLGHIKHTRVNGLNALLDVSRLRDEKVDSYHVGFILAPRLNACGRMGHAKDAVRLLTEAEPVEATRIAKFITAENNRRRATERTIFEEARQLVLDNHYDDDDNRAIVLGKQGWHAGVIGIVASRLVDVFHRPTVLLRFEDGQAHGSARSVPSISIHEAIQSCAHLLTSFGGHAMAAGLSLPTTHIESLRQGLVSYVNARLDPEAMVKVLEIDADCTVSDLTFPLFEQIERLAPFGRDNPAPMLCLRDAELVRSPECVGSDGSHLKLALRNGPHQIDAIGFGLGNRADELAMGRPLDLVFEPKISTWKGRRRMEVQMKDLRPAQM